MKVYITKYALTKGIQARDVKASLVSEGMVRVIGRLHETYHHPHWHASRICAEAQAEKMRFAKIKSLEKQLDKLRRLSFKEADLKVEK